MTISLRSDSGGTSGAVQVNGADVLALTSTGAMTVPTVTGSFKNLKASATGLNATTLVSADEVVVSDGVSSYKILRNVSLSIGAGAGANGLDTGSLAINTWYSLWVIWNGSTVAGLLSLSETAPTMPSGYTFKARVGWIRTDGTANKYPRGFTQFGRCVQWRIGASLNVTSWPIMATQNGLSYSAVGVSSFAPTTAASVRVMTGSGGNSQSASVGPNSDISSATGNMSCGGGANYFIGNFVIDIQLESSNIYFTSNSVGLFSIGWEDNL